MAELARDERMTIGKRIKDRWKKRKNILEF
jgi:hypothetical protein